MLQLSGIVAGQQWMEVRSFLASNHSSLLPKVVHSKHAAEFPGY